MQHTKNKNAKEKDFVPKIDKILLRFVFCCPLAPLRQGRRGLGLASPQRFFGSFLTQKEHQPRLEWEIEKHKWSFSARLAVTSSWSFWSSAIHVALVKARWKTWRRLRLHVAPRVAAVCTPVVPAATNARIARTNEAPAFVVAVGHIIIN